MCIFLSKVFCDCINKVESLIVECLVIKVAWEMIDMKKLMLLSLEDSEQKIYNTIMNIMTKAGIIINEETNK